MSCIFTMINDDFLGDTENLRAITQALVSNFKVILGIHPEGLKLVEIQDNKPELIVIIEKMLVQDVAVMHRHILLISGSHGTAFLGNVVSKSEIIEQAILKQQIIVVWSGHQATDDLCEKQRYLSIVSLLQESVKMKSELQAVFKERLVSTEMVPNTLTVNKLDTALEEWNRTHSKEDYIPAFDNGYLAVFLGGDAPDEEGKYHCYTTEEAFKHGVAFGLEAKTSNKFLAVVSNPRMYRIFPQSPDLKHPVFTRFNKNGWVKFEDLTVQEREIPLAQLSYRAHVYDAPMDPVLMAFKAGIVESGLKEDQYIISDFHFPQKGQQSQSAYQPIIAALWKQKDKSVAYFSGESISYAEIGYFIPKTYAFDVTTMSNLHESFSYRISRKQALFGKVTITDYGQIKTVVEIDLKLKQDTLSNGIQRDVEMIAKCTVSRYMYLIQSETTPLAFVPMLSSIVQKVSNIPISISEDKQTTVDKPRRFSQNLPMCRIL